MAKDIPEGSTAQYKVLLKPTDIGLFVLKRLQRPHLDKSAELRRLVELGYAAEQAGFILDGTVLRHGGKRWETQPDLAGDSSGSAVLGKLPLARSSRDEQKFQGSATASKGSDIEGGLDVPGSAGESADPSGSSLRKKLRGLSG